MENKNDFFNNLIGCGSITSIIFGLYAIINLGSVTGYVITAIGVIGLVIAVKIYINKLVKIRQKELEEN